MTCRTESVILCEPQCWGFEHATFNAAVLETVRLAGPGLKPVFMGEKQHLIHVREAFERATCTTSRGIEWRELVIPARGLTGWRRLKSELALFRRIVKATSYPDVQALILCSLTATGLLVLKTLLGGRRTVPTLAVLHGILSSLESRQPRRPWNWATHLHQVLRLPHPEQLIYLALGGSIYASLSEVVPDAVSNFRVLDPPYFMNGTANPPDLETGVRFGYFGVGRTAERAFDQYVRLAREIRGQPVQHKNQFLIVGHVQTGENHVPLYAGLVQGVSCTSLSLDEYARRAQSVTYAVGFADPMHYRLVASASFLDALCYLKPGIYLRNPYIEYYFNRMGDIGYLCDSYDQVRDVVFSVLREFPDGRYRQQRANILRGRRIFEPGVIAPQLRAIVTERQRALGKPHRDSPWPIR